MSNDRISPVCAMPALGLSLLVALGGCAQAPQPMASAGAVDQVTLRSLNCPEARDRVAAERSSPGILLSLAESTVERCVSLGALSATAGGRP